MAGWAPDDWEKTADIAIRRWDSIGRRRKRFVYSDRVEDLAKGLRDHFERDPKLVGPLMEAYRYLASRNCRGAVGWDVTCRPDLLLGVPGV